MLDFFVSPEMAQTGMMVLVDANIGEKQTG
jgi:hypothetical protein